MNALLLDRRIVMPQPGRLLLLPVALWVAIPMAVLVIALTKAPNLHLSLLTTLIMVAELSAAVTIAHKQILATSPSFFHGGLRRALLRAQFAWALGEAAAVAALVALAPPGAGPAIVVTAFGAALVVHALTALVMLRLTHAYMLPFFILYALFQLPSVMQAGREGKLDAVLGASGWWLAGATLLLWLLARMLLRPDLHRRLCGTMVLGAAGTTSQCMRAVSKGLSAKSGTLPATSWYVSVRVPGPLPFRGQVRVSTSPLTSNLSCPI